MALLVYIILVNYNGADDTVACISSIKNNEYPNYRIVVVDNKSTDNSIEILVNKYAGDHKVIIVESDYNRGFSGGNNLGINIAISDNADSILLLNNDTIVDPRFLIELVNYVGANEQALMLTGKIMYYNEPNRIWYAGGCYNYVKGTGRHLHGNEIDNGQCDEIKEIDFACGCFIFMNRSGIEKVGLMPEEYFLYGEDVAYSLTAKKNKVKIVYIPKSIIYHKVSSSTAKLSELTTYYVIRNRFYVISRHQTGIQRYIAMVSSTIAAIKGIIKGNYNLSMVIKASKDYMWHRMGKYTPAIGKGKNAKDN